MSEHESKTVRVSRWKFLALLTIFAGPLIVATGWYYLADRLAPVTRAHGTLIEPARPLDAFHAPAVGGDEYDLDSLRGRWTIVHVLDDPCGDVCRARIHATRQIREALGHERLRVRRVAVVPDNGAETAIGVTGLLPAHPGLVILHSAQGLAGQLPSERSAATVFLIDPHGNLMMRFDAGVEAGDIHQDLEKLLRISQIG